MKRMIIVGLACLSLAACERLENANSSFRTFATREYGPGTKAIISAQIDVSDTGCSVNGGSTIEKAYRVNIIQAGKTYSGYACHRIGGPDWRVWLDAGTVLNTVR